MQAKDIPVRSVLESIKRHEGTASIFALLADDFPGVPFKVFRAKMDKLGKQGLVDCCCNECGSWIGLTSEGERMLAPKHIYVIAGNNIVAHYSDSGQEK